MLPPTIEANNIATHGSCFSKRKTNENKASITKLLSGVKLPIEPVTDALKQRIYGKLSIYISEEFWETFVASFETWVKVKEKKEAKYS